MSVASVTFYVTACFALLGGLGVILFRQPIRNVLSLVLVMLALSVQFLLLSAQFVFAVQIIVYAGAVMVLFLFVVTLLGPVQERATPRLRIQPWLAVGLVGVFAIMGYAVLQNVTFLKPRSALSPDSLGLGTVESIATGVAGSPTGLFTTYLYPFELTSLLLLMAAVGAIYLSHRES